MSAETGNYVGSGLGEGGGRRRAARDLGLEVTSRRRRAVGRVVTEELAEARVERRRATRELERRVLAACRARGYAGPVEGEG